MKLDIIGSAAGGKSTLAKEISEKSMPQDKGGIRNMKKIKILTVLLCFLLMFAALCGCGDQHSENNNESEVPNSENNETSLYSIKIGDTIYSVGSTLSDDVKMRLAETCEVELIEGDGVFDSSNIYKNHDFEIKTWITEKENTEPSETIYSVTANAGETARGIAVGMTLKDARAEYPDLMFMSGSCVSDEGEFLENTREYCFYDETDGTNNYLGFRFSKVEGKESADGSQWTITEIKAADALDTSREWNTENSGALGDDTIHIEMPDGFTTRIFRENADGSEEELRYFKGSAESAELDGDRLSELVCFESDSGYRNIVILDMIDKKITETDVNKTLECRSSDYAGLIGNLKSEYRNCISAVFEGALAESGTAASSTAGGQTKNTLYDYKDGELSYRCPLEEALN